MFIHTRVEPRGPSGARGSPAPVAEHGQRTRRRLLGPTPSSQAKARKEDAHLPPFAEGEGSEADETCLAAQIVACGREGCHASKSRHSIHTSNYSSPQ